MSSWFSRVFKNPDDKAPAATAERSPAPVEVDLDSADEPEVAAPPKKKARRVVQAPILAEETELSAWSENITIKAKVNEHTDSAIFMIDRPVLEGGYSFQAPDAATAYASSPLAGALFDLDMVSSVALHGMTVSVTRGGNSREGWEGWAKAIGAQIRAHLKSGLPVVDPAWLDQIPPPGELRQALQTVLDEEINPGIAGHSGHITITNIEGNTVYIKMGGGCQGCAASSITLRSGVEKAFRSAAPHMGALLDETDHASGKNPFFKDLPVGMGI